MRFRALMMVTALVAGLGACTAEVEEEGKMPDVDVQGGEMPKVDIDPAQVNVGTDTQQVITPDIDITSTDNDSARGDSAR